MIEAIAHEQVFKAVCDGLLRHEFGPLVQTYAGQGKDGGIDADFWDTKGSLSPSAGRWIFQYKFVAHSTDANEKRRRIRSLYLHPSAGRRGEFEKVVSLAPAGYCLLTNVPLTVELVAQLRKSWSSLCHGSHFVGWDPSTLNPMLKEKEYLARISGTHIEQHCRSAIVGGVWSSLTILLDHMNQDALRMWPVRLANTWNGKRDPVTGATTNQFAWELGPS